MTATMSAASTKSADPLGPDSLTWKYFGDLPTGMMGAWIGTIQNVYPELGAGVEEHSILLREPLQRVARSVAEYFCGGLTEAEQHQLFDEQHVQWYRMYGMSMQPVPETWEDFLEYWERVGREDL